MIEIFTYPFMRETLAMGVLLGLLFSLMGVFVVTRGMAFFSDFVAHSAILGGALAGVAGIESTWFLVPFSLAVAFAVAAVWQAMPLSRDSVLGVFYGGAVGLGVVIISARGLSPQSVTQLLFGDILLISRADIWLALALAVGFGSFVGLRLRQLVKVTFIPEIAEAEGLSLRAYDRALIALMAVTIALSIKLVGVLLANAMVVIPAATAKMLSRSFGQFLVLAPVIGVASFTLGIALAFHLDLPTGPSVVVTAFAIFLAALPIKGLLK
jgi:zinc/manganese transport system permease protein